MLHLLIMGTARGGGWRSDPLWDHAAHLEPRCSISKSSAAAAFSLDDNLTEPLLVQRSAATTAAGGGLWDDRDSFVRRYGDVVVHPRGALLTAEGGASKQHAEESRGRTRAARALRDVLNDADDDGRIVFESAGRERKSAVSAAHSACSSSTNGNGTCGGTIRKWWTVMRSELEPLVRQHADDAEPVLSIGRTGSGLARHTHGSAWLALLGSGGGKLWLLHAPTRAGTAWAAERKSTLYWLQRLLSSSSSSRTSRKTPRVPKGVQWCIQLPGETLLLPAFWHHQTLNIGETIAVGGQQNRLQWNDAGAMVRELEAQQKEQLAPNPRLLEAVAGALRRDGEEETSLGFLLAAVDAEPLNTRLALRAAAQAHLVGRRAVVVKLLRGAVATLAELEASGSVRPADAAERGAELGIAVVTLAKEESAIALPLLLRGAAQRKLDPAVLTQVPPVVDQMGPDQRDVELLYTLAYAHGRSGEREEAMRLLRRVVAMDPNHVDARKILRVFQR